MKPYPEYKPTGLAWLPEIPKHWKSAKLRNLLSIVSKKNHPEQPLLSVVREKGVIRRDVDSKEENHNYIPEDLSNYKVVRKGQFAMNKMKAWQGSYGISQYDGIVSPAYFVFDLHGVSADFFNIAIRSKAYIPYFAQASDGIRVGQWDLSLPRMHEIPFFIPPADEQAQIVRYLDAMTAKINKLIRAKKRQIALLQEQKQAIINQAVTRGLDPDVELKDSGIDWLGPIPKHWKTCRCRYLFKEKNNRSETGNEVHLSMSQRHGLIPDSKLAERCILSETYVGGKLCLEDDLVLNRLKAHLGVFSLAQQSGVVSPDYTVLQVYKSKILPQYSELVLKSQSCRRELQLRVRGIVEGFWRLYTDDFNEISLPLPSLREQQKILASILDKSEKINLIIQQGREKISLLTEYKNALIAAVVTGKVDVRNIAVEAVSAEDLTPSDDPDESEEQDSTIPEESEE